MSRRSPYLYRERKNKDKPFADSERIYSVRGLHPLATVKGLTKEEAQVVVDAFHHAIDNKLLGKPEPAPALLSPGEVCKPVPGWENAYSITNHGRVWSHVRQRFLAVQDSGELLTVSLVSGSKKITVSLGVLMYQTFINVNVKGVRYKDKNYRNVAPDNLIARSFKKQMLTTFWPGETKVTI